MNQRHRGFTLVELSIVMVIVSLMVGMGLNVLLAQMTNSRYAETRIKQEAIKQALISFIARNNRLPCPANPALAAGDALYGAEAATPGACAGIASSGSVVTGIVPWMSIGLPEEMATDGFFARFTYQVVQAATNLNAQTVAGMRGAISLHSASPVSMGAAPAGNQINDCSNGLTNNPCAAVVMIVSHGRNSFGAHLPSGNRVPTIGAGPDELANTDNDAQFVKRDFSDSGANAFDDVLMAISPIDLLSPLAQRGAISDARAALNSTFVAMRGMVEAAAINGRSAAPPGAATFQLPFSLASVPNDPWGNAISYQRTTDIIAAGTAPGVGFTMTSAGPDGTLGTSDDIAMVVSVSELQSIFARTGF